MDSTHVKVHRDGANPAGGQAPQFIGKAPGGNNTKIHGVVDEHMRLLALRFTAGNSHDNTQAQALIKGCKGSDIVELVADRAYDANPTRQACVDEGLRACIPSRSNRKEPVVHDSESFKKRHVVENFWEVIKR